MSVAAEPYIAARFDTLHHRFRDEVARDDPRLRALIEALGPLDGRRILDLGCGKGRFARHLQDAGAWVVGLDRSRGMLEHAAGLPRLQATARRLPFSASCFDAVIAVEVLEHLPAVEAALAEAVRVLRPGGILLLIDKNAGSLDARFPWLPSLARKWIDERRGLWMYPANAPVRERWFWTSRLAWELRARLGLEGVGVRYLLTRRESLWWVFRRVPATRLFVLWSARKPGGRP